MSGGATLDLSAETPVTRLFLGPRQFAKLENWCDAAPGRRPGETKVAAECRARWKAQLDKRRGHLTARQRGGATTDEERWLDVTAKDLLFISVCHLKPRGAARAIDDIFTDQ